MTLHLNGQTIRVEHVAPAHTDGDSIVFFEEANVVHMGDTFFNGLYPYIDAGSGGTVDGMIAAADGVLARVDADTVIMPGHGPLTRPAGPAEIPGYAGDGGRASANGHRRRQGRR